MAGVKRTGGRAARVRRAVLEAALALLLDKRVDFREPMWMLFAPETEPTRLVAQSFFRRHQDELLARMPKDEVAGTAAEMTTVFTSSCDAARRNEVVEYVDKEFATLPGGARAVKQAIESMDQCIASKQMLEPEIRAWLGGYKPAKPKAAKPSKAGDARKK